jgi:hypothetical protein
MMYGFFIFKPLNFTHTFLTFYRLRIYMSANWMTLACTAFTGLTSHRLSDNTLSITFFNDSTLL